MFVSQTLSKAACNIFDTPRLAEGSGRMSFPPHHFVKNKLRTRTEATHPLPRPRTKVDATRKRLTRTNTTECTFFHGHSSRCSTCSDHPIRHRVNTLRATSNSLRGCYLVVNVAMSEVFCALVLRFQGGPRHVKWCRHFP